MARKPRMGRNLNALLNSAVKERREQNEAPPPPLEAQGGDAEAETSAASPPPAPSGPGAPRDAAPATARRAASSAGVADLAVVRLPAGRADVKADESRGGFGEESVDASRGAEPPETLEPSGGEGDADEEGSGERSAEAAGEAAAELEARVSRIVPPAASAHAEEDEAPGDPPRPGDRLRMIGVERIRRGVFQPRRFFDQEALQELADSLRAQGMIQPVVVRPIGDVFELIAGERRWRAAQIAGLDEIPAIVREMEDRSVAAVSLIENIQREDLNPLEEAQALMRLCDEFGMTHASVAESIGRSRAAVSNLMRLLELHDEVKAMVDKGELDMGHARALLRVPTVDQPALAARVAKQGLTVRAVEKLIRTGTDKATPEEGSKAEAALDPDVERLVERLSGVLGAPVSIRHKAGGAGKLEIRYGSLDELDGILAHIR